MVSKKLIAAIKLGSDPAYKVAHRAGIDPSTLSKLICGIVKVKNGDIRVIKVGKVLGLKPSECFQESEGLDQISDKRAQLYDNDYGISF